MLRRIILLGIALALAGAANPLVTSVDAIIITVSDLDRAVDFYSNVLQFQKVSEGEVSGEPWEHATGVFGMRLKTARLQLGEESIELREFLAPQGRPIPEHSLSNDRWFQHVAIITTDMKRAYERLRQFKVRHASSGPQRLPDWNPNAGGIEAFYFKDPDGHVLEVLAFPTDKGAARWHRSEAGAPLFLGIDHTAIVISNTEASMNFYRDTLGLTVVGASENYGPEQEQLNNVFGARLRITSLRAASGPGVEFLEYLAPTTGRPYPADAQPNDLIHWQTRFTSHSADQAEQALRGAHGGHVSAGVVSLPVKSSFRKSIVVRDPDGHAIEVSER